MEIFWEVFMKSLILFYVITIAIIIICMAGFLAMVIFGDVLFRILSFVPCVIFSAATIVLILFTTITEDKYED